MIDTKELFEMGLAALPVGLMVAASALLTRFVLVEKNLMLPSVAVFCLVAAIVLSTYLGTERVSREYGGVFQKYR